MLLTIDGINYRFSRKLPKLADKSIQYVLIRLLIGALDVGRGNAFFHQRTNYAVPRGAPQHDAGAKAVEKFFKLYSISRSVDAFVKVTVPSNRVVFQDVLAELANYFVATSKGAHTSAFVFLYRALERVSYSVPLLYCTSTKDYVGSFDLLKKLFTEDAVGELGFFKKFVKSGDLIDSLELLEVYKIDFSLSANKARNFKALSGLGFGQFTIQNAATHNFELRLRDIPELLVTVRNRFFHSRTGDGQKNLRMSEVVDSDSFFEAMNGVFLSFISIVVLRTIAKTYG